MSARCRFIVAGPPWITNKCYVFGELEDLLGGFESKEIELLVYDEPGVAKLAVEYAKSNGIKYRMIPLDWETHENLALIERDMAALDLATHLIAIWDGVHRGTDALIRRSKEASVRVCVSTPPESILKEKVNEKRKR